MKQIVAGLIGFIAGSLIVFVFFTGPTQRLLYQSQQLVTQQAVMNRDEAQRISQQKNISEAQMQKWVATVEDASRQYQEVMLLLHQQEEKLRNPGIYYISFMVVLLAFTVAFYVWVNRNENMRDLITFENFKGFINQLLTTSTRQPVGAGDSAPGHLSEGDSQNLPPGAGAKE